MQRPHFLVLCDGAEKATVYRGLGLEVHRELEVFLTSASTNRPAVVVLDLKFSDLLGLNLFQRLVELLPGVPLLVVAEYREREALLEQLNEGKIFSYQFRPVDGAELLRALGRSAQNGQPETVRPDDVRSSPRVPVAVWVEDLNNVLLPPIYTYNLSRTGVSLSTSHLTTPDLLRGQELRLRFSLPDDGPATTITGTIVWVRPNTSNELLGGYLLGVHFNALPTEVEQRILRFLTRFRYNLLLFSEDEAFQGRIEQSIGGRLGVIRCTSTAHTLAVLENTPVSFLWVDGRHAQALELLTAGRRLVPEAVRVLLGRDLSPALLIEALERTCLDRVLDPDGPIFDRSLQELMEVYELKLYHKHLLKQQLEAGSPKDTRKASLSPWAPEPLMDPDLDLEPVQREEGAVLAVTIACEVLEAERLDDLSTLVGTFLFEVGDLLEQAGGEAVGLPLHVGLGLFHGERVAAMTEALEAAGGILEAFGTCFADLPGISTTLGFGLSWGSLLNHADLLAGVGAAIHGGTPIRTALMLASLGDEGRVFLDGELAAALTADQLHALQWKADQAFELPGPRRIASLRRT